MKANLMLNEEQNTCTGGNLATRACRKVLQHLRTLREAIEAEFASAREAQRQLVHLALNEAEALAWQTTYPHLTFPVLAQEKVRAVTQWERRQAMIRSREMQPHAG